MSIVDALRRVAYLVEGVAPETGGPFVWQDRDAGACPPLESAYEGADRLFDLADVLTADAGEGGCVPARVRLSVSLRIRYRTAGSRHALSAQQADDVRRIRDQLMFTPADYDFPSTGLDAIFLGTPGPAAPVVNLGQTVAVHEILTIPLTMEVRP